MSEGEKMVWAAAFVAALHDSPGIKHAEARAIVAAGEAVFALRAAHAMIGHDVHEGEKKLPYDLAGALGHDVRHSYEQIVYDRDDAAARDREA